MTKRLSGWGRYPVVEAETCSVDSLDELRGCLNAGGELIPHGLGRSYGDSALGQRAVLTRRLGCILSFDPEAGVVECEAGVSLAELIDAFLPRGWFLSVTPGTKFVTVGGAIASDVHGKNHHRSGCFSECVESFDLMLPDGGIVRCSKSEHADLFHATCGGMGLTGLIVSARVRLQKVNSFRIRQTIFKARNLAHILELFDKHGSWTYSVAWIDCLSRGKRLGRSLLMVGEHAEDGDLAVKPKRALTVPVDFPSMSLNRMTVSLFNALYYHRQRRDVLHNVTDIDTFFYPLDAVYDWNRIYGKRGFTQYQFVLPRESGSEGMTRILTKIAESGLGSFLAVLKLFGPGNDNLLSFPREGYTLALDFKIEDRLFGLLNSLDAIVLDHGGRIYLTKDVRMAPETFAKGYPRLEEFRVIRKKYDLEGMFQSLQSRRLRI